MTLRRRCACNQSTIILVGLVTFLIFVPVFMIIGHARHSAIYATGDRGEYEQQAEDLQDDHIKDWHATDPRLIQHIRKHYLQPPSTLPYNLNKPDTDDWSQKGQSTHALELLRNRRNGFFVESGGYDGETWSNTLKLEKYYNYTGLLVEPDANNLQQMRSKNRKSWIANACINGGEYPTKMNMIGAMELGALDTYVSSTRLLFNRLWGPVQGTLVWCFPLGSLLRAVNVTNVDYMSLDMEGAEIDVLNGLVKDRGISVNVIQVEWQIFIAAFFDTTKSEIRQKQIKEIFERNFPDMSFRGIYYLDMFFSNNTQNV